MTPKLIAGFTFLTFRLAKLSEQKRFAALTTLIPGPGIILDRWDN